jgi:membrane protease YdiL (CAAX protease family)
MQLKDTSYLFRFLFLTVLVLFSSSLGGALVMTFFALYFNVGYDVMNTWLTRPQEYEHAILVMKGLQLMQGFAMFIIPSVIYIKLIGEQTRHFLTLGKYIYLKPLLLVLLIVICVSPLVEEVYLFNQNIAFPECLHSVENLLKAKEAQMEELTNTLLQMDSIMGLFVNLILIALLPALGEELLFRGVIQKEMIRFLGNRHYGIWVTAVIFSAIHFQFYGFLPRMLLGALFGYIFEYSRTIYYAFIAHFVNNATVVMAYYLYQHHYIDYNIAQQSSFPILYIVIFSSVAIWSLCKFISISKY